MRTADGAHRISTKELLNEFDTRQKLYLAVADAVVTTTFYDNYLVELGGTPNFKLQTQNPNFKTQNPKPLNAEHLRP